MQSTVITLKTKPTTNKLAAQRIPYARMVFSMQLQNNIALNQIHLMYVSFKNGGNKQHPCCFFSSNLSDHKPEGFFQKQQHIMDLCGTEYLSLFVSVSLYLHGCDLLPYYHLQIDLSTGISWIWLYYSASWPCLWKV